MKFMGRGRAGLMVLLMRLKEDLGLGGSVAANRTLRDIKLLEWHFMFSRIVHCNNKQLRLIAIKRITLTHI
jgi:hypothetical protein